ncbi:hypothetical protein AYO44_11460 [Planctomycetaceae bacterium SCGC AG-212-F19]|nr:hypothetical protein AYO44_11460 [Planctomycetaceae bacterium SCGC AG-212-F19]
MELSQRLRGLRRSGCRFVMIRQHPRFGSKVIAGYRRLELARRELARVRAQFAPEQSQFYIREI